MALFIRQNEDRSKLQERLAAELQERQTQKDIKTKDFNGVEDSAYLKDTKDASSLTWVWIVIFVVIGGLALYYVYRGTVR